MGLEDSEDQKRLRCRGISKCFGGVRAVSDVSLAFPASGICALVGPNGAGKTTLLNIFAGFVRPEAGQCFLGDREITWLAPHRIARLGVARTFQDLRLIQQVPALENILLSLPQQHGEGIVAALGGSWSHEETRNREAALGVLRSVGLEHKACEPAGELSYGEQKLLALGCCLASGARILLLDEPVAGAHPEMASRVVALLRQSRDAGKLVVFVEHDVSAVREAADIVVVMDQGRVIAEGPPGDVFQRPEIIEAYLA
jgi:ABC-type branched-subunit amino acid transport system ATPase component